MQLNVYSIEPISQKSVEKIETILGCHYCYVDRNSFLDRTDIHDDVKILICRDRDAVSEIIDCCRNLTFLFIVSTGVEKLPFLKLIKRNILVANTGGINAPIMSEYAMAYILSQSARVCENLRNQLNVFWKKYQCVDSLANQKLLIVGAGKTGQLLAHKAKAFEMKVVGIKKHVSKLKDFDEVDSLGNIDRHLNDADFVVLTIPLTPETKGLFDYDRLKKMKKTSVLINISRSRIVCQNDLIQALDEGVIGCAVLDVFDEEPLPTNNKMWQMDNLIITPHSSGRLTDFMDKAMLYFIDNMKAFANKEPLPNKVDLNAGY